MHFSKLSATSHHLVCHVLCSLLGDCSLSSWYIKSLALAIPKGIRMVGSNLRGWKTLGMTNDHRKIVRLNK